MYLNQFCFQDYWNVLSAFPVFKNIGEMCGEKLLRYFLVFVISKIFGKNEKFFGHLTKCCFFFPGGF